jgi:ATP adenylyltransferase
MYFDLHDPELRAINVLLDQVRRLALAADKSIGGFNVGMNCGATAGQTIMHCHVHLIPRRKGDVEQPGGGVRGVIPGEQPPSADVAVYPIRTAPLCWMICGRLLQERTL